VPWTVVDSGRKNKKQQPERYIPGLNQPTIESKPVDTEEYWREQANIAKQRMREAFLHAAQLRRYVRDSVWDGFCFALAWFSQSFGLCFVARVVLFEQRAGWRRGA
jgi:hypothetical protein